MKRAAITVSEKEEEGGATTMQLHEFPHSGADDDAAFIYVKVNLQYLRKVRHANGNWITN